MVLGTQLFLAGFLGEIILNQNNEERYNRMKLILINLYSPRISRTIPSPDSRKLIRRAIKDCNE
jgi:hypothetical protein